MYYPKSQIKTNLYSDKKSLILATSTPDNILIYEGPYYETSSNKKFTGKFPGDGNNELLLPVETKEDIILPSDLSPEFPDGDTQIPNNKNIITSGGDLKTYTPFVNVNDRIIPPYYTPVINEEIQKKGYIERYFCKKNNEYRYIEISKDTYTRLQNEDDNIAWDLYTPISLRYNLLTQTSNAPLLEQNLGWVGFSSYIRPLKSSPSIFPPANESFLPPPSSNSQNTGGY